MAGVDHPATEKGFHIDGHTTTGIDDDQETVYLVTANELELYDFIVDYVRSGRLREAEDEGTSHLLLLLDDLINPGAESTGQPAAATSRANAELSTAASRDAVVGSNTMNAAWQVAAPVVTDTYGGVTHGRLSTSPDTVCLDQW